MPMAYAVRLYITVVYICTWGWPDRISVISVTRA
eukprot:SAG25_NODE_11979_length_290_cov_1.062827_1_plen_33_part_10